MTDDSKNNEDHWIFIGYFRKPPLSSFLVLPWKDIYGTKQKIRVENTESTHSVKIGVVRINLNFCYSAVCTIARYALVRMTLIFST